MIIILIVGGFGLLAAGISLRALTPGGTPLTWSLFKQPEALTEVFFSGHKTLPTTYSPGETFVVDFTIVNKEGQTMAYPFEIIAEGEGGHIALVTGSVSVEDGQTKAHRVPIVYPNLGLETRIILSLPEQNQSLQYIAKRRES